MLDNTEETVNSQKESVMFNTEDKVSWIDPSFYNNTDDEKDMESEDINIHSIKLEEYIADKYVVEKVSILLRLY